MRPIENFVKVESDGVFSLWLNRPVYKIYKTEVGYIKNLKTGENMGQSLELHMNLYDEHYRRREDIEYEEDCYEIAEDTND